MNKASVVANFCKSCGLCVKFCPKRAIRIGDTRNNKGHYNSRVDAVTASAAEFAPLFVPRRQ